MKKWAATDMEFPIRGNDGGLFAADIDAFFRLESVLGLRAQAAEERHRKGQTGNTTGQNAPRKKSDLREFLDIKRG